MDSAGLSLGEKNATTLHNPQEYFMRQEFMVASQSNGNAPRIVALPADLAPLLFNNLTISPLLTLDNTSIGLFLPKKSFLLTSAPLTIKLNQRFRNTKNNAIELAKCIAIVISKYALFSSLINSLKDPPIHAGIKIA